MPSQQEVKWSQLKVGLIVLASVTILCVLLFLMTSASGLSLFSKKITAVCFFPNANGLKPGAAVNLEGVAVGEVTKVQISTDPARKLTPVELTLKLDPRYSASLHTDTLAGLSTVGVLGDTVLDLNSQAATGPTLKDGDELKPVEVPSIQDVVKSSQGTLQTLNGTLAKLDHIVDGLGKGQGTAGQFLTNPELYNRLNSTVAQLQTLATNLNSGRGSAGKLLHDDDVYTKLDDTVTRLDTLASNLSTGKGTAGKLLTDDALYNNLNSTLAHANSLLAEADAGRGGLGLLTKNPQFAAKLDGTVTKLDTLLNGMNNGQGTLGKLVTDDAAYNNLNKLLTESTTLVTTIRQDPKKYLTIHMKIF